MSNPLKVGQKHGVLKITEIYGADKYYCLLSGTNADGQTRQLVTRGPGRHLAATRIPIRVPAGTASRLARCAVAHHLPVDNALDIVRQEFSQWSPSDNMEDLQRWDVPLMLMPREGSLECGNEWNAPGGTGEPNETQEEIAKREFNEESDLTPLFLWQPFPLLRFASGIYDERQQVSFVFVTGTPAKLTEGAKEWKPFPLLDLEALSYPDPASSDKFIPIDGKVVMAVMYAVQRLLKLI